jgi:site-specific DNA recombinase
VVNDAEPTSVIPTPDLTFFEVGRIHSGYMTPEMGRVQNTGPSKIPVPLQGVTRAALYARVSDPHSAKEGNIESQVLALREQIAAAGHVLVKEYIDNGFSGPRFDRPALDEMRKDLNTDAFDVIYFHQADRIAREVVIQTIIIEEILKHRKRLVINSKDYEKNPENHFMMQALGLVAELERAKIIERTTRGRQYRLSQGQLMGSGYNTFGYDYIRKSPGNPPRMVVNEREAAIVRRIFETYAGTQIGLESIAQQLETEGILTKTGKKLWRRSFLKVMLSNETYLGMRYFNKLRTIREYANPMYGIKHSTKKNVPRDREEWVGVEVPQIISQELFDRVQKRKASNRKRYRNPRQPQLLSTLVQCGVCGHKAFSLRVWQRSKRKGPVTIIHKHYYMCTLRDRGYRHSKGADIFRCKNPFVTGSILEGRILSTIREVMLDPLKLRDAMDYFKEDAAQVQSRAEEEVRSVESCIAALREQKRRVIDVYASGDLSRETYVEKNRELDAEMEVLRDRSKELMIMTARYETTVIDGALAQYCAGARNRFEQCSDFASTRQFLLDYVDKIVLSHDNVAIVGLIPLGVGEQSLPFRIETAITQEDRRADRLRRMEETRQRQLVTMTTQGRSTSRSGHTS